MDNKYYEMWAESEEETENSVAKEVTVPNTHEVRHYIKTNKGQLLNPNAGDFFRQKGRNAKWQKVDAETFTLYVRYLNSGTERYLNYAKRGIQR